MNRTRWIPVAALAVVGSALVGAAAAVSNRSGAYAWFDPIVDVHGLVTREFVEEPDREAMLRGALSGMLEALNDPYTEFIPAKDVAEFDKQTRGNFVGIGAEVRMQEGGAGLLIVSPLEDSPAYRAGVMAGDVVTHVDGKPTRGLNVQEVISMLTGEPGTPVTITIDREGHTFDMTLTRARITTPIVKGVHRLEDDSWDFWIDPSRKIAYVRLTQFTESSSRDLKAVIQRLLSAGMDRGGLVLDLRFNPGGLLSSAVDISDLFLREGTIVSTRGRAHAEQRFVARSPGTVPDFPVVVLVNRASASASEIVAGAIADNGRGVVLGERTFGKGSVQNVAPLPSGAGQVKLTEQYYYLPSGRNIQRKDDSTLWGVDPSPGFYVPMKDEEYRAMLEARRQQEIIKGKDAERADEGNWSDPAWILEQLKDKQLAAAVEAIRGRLATGKWEPVGDAPPEGSLTQAELKRLAQERERLTRYLARLDRRAAALEAAGAVAKAEEKEIVPEGVDLTGGQIVLFDKEGKRLTTLRITGPGLSDWLQDAPLTKEETSEQ